MDEETARLSSITNPQSEIRIPQLNASFLFLFEF